MASRAAGQKTGGSREVIKWVLAGVALLSCQMAMAQFTPAAAAAPQVAGKYAYMQISQCEAQLTTAKDENGKVTDVNTVQNGLMSVGNGYITFNPKFSGATHGTAIVNGSNLIEGGSVRVNGNGFSWHQKLENFRAPYSFAATTFTVGGQVYAMTYANLVNGFYQTIYLVQLDTTNGSGNPNCLNAITATRQ